VSRCGKRKAGQIHLNLSFFPPWLSSRFLSTCSHTLSSKEPSPQSLSTSQLCPPPLCSSSWLHATRTSQQTISPKKPDRQSERVQWCGSLLSGLLWASSPSLANSSRLANSWPTPDTQWASHQCNFILLFLCCSSKWTHNWPR